MRLLVLGGSVFLSRAVAEEALARGHEVVCACRGRSGPVPDGADHVELDRTQPLPETLQADAATYDAVVDVARHPSWVRAAVAATPEAHWVFVSTINVYADESTPGGTPGSLPLREPHREDADLSVDMEAYGPMKVACESIVRAGARSSTVVRPGLVVGPGDPTGRFTYWPARFAAVDTHPTVLAPGDPDDLVQVVDVRDLAAWLVTLAERRTTGTFDGVGPATPVRDLLAAVALGSGGGDALLRWTARDALEAHGVEPWAGPRSLPLWLPRPEYDGLVAHDADPSLDAGLVVRPVEDTARDTLAWLRATPDAPVTGLTRDEEAAVLAAL
ncbi:NAD-dependent epimerase/dehydratase family protein [Nocardioides sp. Arc9.136]|uniref:NAD-dependent epimerase/dehydratase family protein n=1 Tax=Nocardioides sp. Arc9.136 TaxID=2996826 RepID=UPI0026666891|nr:NAD-dependent epimerase/dehydratase family protein [Nocardioides sp. Arc9.136]WKN48329.1 NAD-dependent epimerase/dehydratase family protein [Nocardioides sp. Arc9.136]